MIVAIIIIPAVLLVAFLAYYFLILKKSKSTNKTSNKATSLVNHELNKLNANTEDDNNGANDVLHLLKNLHPSSSTHLDVLLVIATTPENMKLTQQAMDKEKELKQKRREFLNPEASSDTDNGSSAKESSDTSSNSKNDTEFDLDGAWGDDDEDEEDANVKANKARQAEKERLAKEVAAASGKAESMMKHVKIEGIDEGVLGQKWVENTLAENGVWPPQTSDGLDLDLKKGIETNEAMRRNVCMTMGRLHANVLNTHPALIEAGPKRLIDTIYFQSSMEYRKRTIVLLEAALRIIGSTRSYKLYKTLVECYTMFKIGTPSVSSPEIISNYQKMYEKTFDGPKGVPRIIISKLEISTPAPDNSTDANNNNNNNNIEIAAGDTTALELELHRVHGENFMKQKIAMAVKQGIPPQIALQTFREGWWILLRCEKLNDSSSSSNAGEFIDQHPILAKMSSDIKDKFKQETNDNLLINAWPFMVSNMKQLVGKVKVRFIAPKVPGSYKFYIDVKSQEYLGCDQTFTLEREILEKKKEDGEGAEDIAVVETSGEADEPKKTK